MRRAIFAGIAILLATGLGAALYLTGAGRERKHPSVQTPRVRPAAEPADAPQAPEPPMSGRVAIDQKQFHEALAAGLVDRPVKSLLKVSSRMTYGDFVWNDTGVAPGPTWVRVDLNSQIISVFRSGHEIGHDRVDAGHEQDRDQLAPVQGVREGRLVARRLFSGRLGGRAVRSLP